MVGSNPNSCRDRKSPRIFQKFLLLSPVHLKYPQRSHLLRSLKFLSQSFASLTNSLSLTGCFDRGVLVIWAYNSGVNKQPQRINCLKTYNIPITYRCLPVLQPHIVFEVVPTCIHTCRVMCLRLCAYNKSKSNGSARFSKWPSKVATFGSVV